jgi:hypothetical protein
MGRPLRAGREELTMQNAESNPTPEQQREIAARSPVKTPAAGLDMPDAATQAAGFAAAPRRLSPETVAAKVPTGLPPIDADAYASDSADPVRRAASRIVTLDNANMAATDDTVDVDGKGMEARKDASEWHDNVIHSNASLDDSVATPDDGLGGFESRPSGNLPRLALRAGWRMRYVGTVEVAHGYGKRAEHVICLERTD